MDRRSWNESIHFLSTDTKCLSYKSTAAHRRQWVSEMIRTSSTLIRRMWEKPPFRLIKVSELSELSYKKKWISFAELLWWSAACEPTRPERQAKPERQLPPQQPNDGVESNNNNQTESVSDDDALPVFTARSESGTLPRATPRPQPRPKPRNVSAFSSVGSSVSDNTDMWNVASLFFMYFCLHNKAFCDCNGNASKNRLVFI